MKVKIQAVWFSFAIVLLLAGLAYHSAAHSPLFFDDIPNLVDNPPLHIDGRKFDSWRTAATSSDAGPLLRPISMFSFAANYVIFEGFTPISLKAVNLAIHLTIAILIYFLALNIFRSPVLSRRTMEQMRLAAFGAAAIWLLHPLHVSTVAYAVQRMAQLSALFTVLGLLVYVRYRLQWVSRPVRAGELIAALLWLALITLFATLSKENGALLPWLVVAVEASLFRGRWNGSNYRLLTGLSWCLLLVPLIAIGLILLLSPELFTSGYQARDFTMMERLMTQSRVLWHYVSWILWPDITVMGFQHDDIPVSKGLFEPLTTSLALLAWFVCFVFAVLQRNRHPLVIFAVLFFIVAQVMESSVLALEMTYEHRNYLPSIGVFILMAHTLTSEGLWKKKVRLWLPLTIVLAGLSVLLFFRTQTWSGQLSLARSNVINHPSSTNAQFFYAEALLEQYRLLEINGQGGSQSRKAGQNIIVGAREHLLLALEASPTDTAALVMLLYVDSYFFPELPSKEGWTHRLYESLDNRALHASDQGALSFLVECSTVGGCGIEPVKIASLLHRLIQQNPKSVELLLLKHQSLLAAGVPYSKRIAPLNLAAVLAPGHPAVQVSRIREESGQGDVSSMYEIVRHWMAVDPKRRSLPSIMPLFSKEQHVPKTVISHELSQRE